jgi:hypothetical protein
MKRYLLLIVLMLAGTGCVTVANSVIPPAGVLRPEERVTLGMTRAMVAAVMDGKVIVGYVIDGASGVSRPVEAQKLFSSEISVINGASCQIDRYIVRPPAPGARVSEADLFPVVYKDGLVVAAGREGLAGIRAAK